MIKISPDWALLCKIMGTEDPTEVQLELRGQIVQEFARRYLKGITATEQFAQCVSEIKRAVRDEFEKALSAILVDEDPKRMWSTPRYSLKSEFKMLIAQEIEATIRGTVLEAIREKLGNMDEEIKTQMEKLEDWKKRHIQEVVKDTITKMVAETAKSLLPKEEKS